MTCRAPQQWTTTPAARTPSQAYVWQEVKMGVMYARNKLTLVDEATGKAGVNECSLIAQ
jgi:hypothetical protein